MVAVIRRHWHTRSTFARHRIRHGIRHTAAGAGRRPRPCIANGRLRHILIGYARVSKADGSQSLDLQRDALQAAGVDAVNVYHDFASGVRDDRPGLDSCVRALRPGRTGIVKGFNLPARLTGRLTPPAASNSMNHALKRCRECKGEVATDAAACPRCGATAPTRERSVNWVPCKACGSVNTCRIDYGLAGFAAMIESGRPIIRVPIIGWVVTPFAVLMAAFCWVFRLIPSEPLLFHCQACKRWFKVATIEIQHPHKQDD